jgi:DNA-directed RNA polymerase subunit H
LVERLTFTQAGEIKRSRVQIPSGPLIFTTRLQRKTKKMTIKANAHQLVSKHQKVKDSEKESLFKKYHIDAKSLPRILREDSAIKNLNVEIGDVIKIDRLSKTAGKTVYFRVVVDG